MAISRSRLGFLLLLSCAALAAGLGKKKKAPAPEPSVFDPLAALVGLDVATLAKLVPGTAGALCAALLFWLYDRLGPKRKCDVVLVGCGAPKRGMGWYHLTQLMRMDCANVTAVVEPWYLGPGKAAPGAKEFMAMKAQYEAEGVAFYGSIAAMPDATRPTCALIAGRTADNPKFFADLVAKGVKSVYLEKPGAPSVAALEEMKALADARGVKVFLGYNKNVTEYVTLARDVEARTDGATVTFIHNNAYKKDELTECFARNAEGMLKNMAVHELALLVTYYGVTSTSIAEVIPLPLDSCVETLGDKTDFSKIGFTIKTKKNKVITVKADRCGGSCSYAVVSLKGKEVFRSVTPDPKLKERVDKQQAADPEMMPYFFLQSDDYWTLKQRVLEHVAGKPGAPAGIATIDIAIETLKVAEYLTPLLKARLASNRFLN